MKSYKWFDIKSEAKKKKKVAKYKRKMQTTGGGAAYLEISELDQHNGAIIGATAPLIITDNWMITCCELKCEFIHFKKTIIISKIIN